MAKYIADEGDWAIETDVLTLGGEAVIKDKENNHEMKGRIMAIAFNNFTPIDEQILYGSYDYTGTILQDYPEPEIYIGVDTYDEE